MSTSAFSMHLSEAKALLAQWREHSRAAHADGGVSPARQLAELALLRIGPGKLNAKMYYQLRVYRDSLDFNRKREFISDYALGATLRGGRWGAIPDDKLLTCILLEASGLPVPELRALCHPHRFYPHCAMLRSCESIANYLRQNAQQPFFAKPIKGINGIDAMHVAGAQCDRVLLGDRSSLSLSEFSAKCLEQSDGFIFQELLEPHSDVAVQFGGGLCTVRIVALMRRERWHPFAALFKIVAPGNMADNYWRPGNVMAEVDLATGRLGEACSGLGPDHRRLTTFGPTGASIP